MRDTRWAVRDPIIGVLPPNGGRGLTETGQAAGLSRWRGGATPPPRPPPPMRPERRHLERAAGGGDPTVRSRLRGRRGTELPGTGRGVEPAVQVRPLRGDPDLPGVIERRVRVARGRRQRVLLDRARGRV